MELQPQRPSSLGAFPGAAAAHPLAMPLSARAPARSSVMTPEVTKEPGSNSTLLSARSQPATARTGQRPDRPADRRGLNVRPASKEEQQARQRAQIWDARHQALQKEREVMAQQIQERRERSVQLRDSKFEALWASVMEDTGFKAEVGDAIRKHEAHLETKQQEIYNRWDSAVGQRVENQITKHMSTVPPKLPSGFRDALHRSDDPLKAEHRASETETNFHRAADMVLNRPSTVEDAARGRGGRPGRKDKTRPVFPIKNWDQRVHYASSYGSFIQACLDQEDGWGFTSQRRMGPNAHQLNESDGIATAGKTRSRLEKNTLGMLEGTLAREGQSARFKVDGGGGSGAPCQDHYHYERGAAVPEAEMPLGRRVFPKAAFCEARGVIAPAAS